MKTMLLPSATDFEAAVIGAVLGEKNAAPLAMKHLTHEMFYDTNHATIFSVVEKMYAEGSSIDLLTVSEELKRNGKLEEVGGCYGLTVLTSYVLSSAHLETHCLVVKDKYVRRTLIFGLQKLAGRALSETEETADILGGVHSLIDHVEDACSLNLQLRTMPTLLADTLAQAEKRVRQSHLGVTGIPTGLTELDSMTSGWQPGDLNLLAARPSVGKTALALHMAKAAARAGYNTVFYSIEMCGERLADRWLMSESRIPAGRWKRGQLEPGEMEQVRAIAGSLEQLPIRVDDSSHMSIDYIRASARMLHSKGKCDIIFIDYLQLTDMKADKANRNREQEVAQATRKVKLMAKEMGIPVIVLSQLNRESENRPGKKPALADLRESGSIEQDADLVMLLYRPRTAGFRIDKESGYPTDNLGVVMVAKHRNGETGNVYFGHTDSMTAIGDYAPPLEWMRKNVV